MTVAGFRIRFEISIIGVLMLMGFGTSRALAQDDHPHGMTPAQHEQTPEQKRQAGALSRPSETQRGSSRTAPLKTMS